MADYKLGYSMTGAPLGVKDKVIVGVAGDGTRAGQSGRTGAAATWVTGSYDPAWHFQFTPHEVRGY